MAFSKALTGSSLVFSEMISKAPNTMRSAMDFLPSFITTLMNLAMERFTSAGWSVYRMSVFGRLLSLIPLRDILDSYFGRLVPYLERRCLRPSTPVVSRLPRTMW